MLALLALLAKPIPTMLPILLCLGSHQTHTCNLHICGYNLESTWITRQACMSHCSVVHCVLFFLWLGTPCPNLTYFMAFTPFIWSPCQPLFQAIQFLWCVHEIFYPVHFIASIWALLWPLLFTAMFAHTQHTSMPICPAISGYYLKGVLGIHGMTSVLTQVRASKLTYFPLRGGLCSSSAVTTSCRVSANPASLLCNGFVIIDNIDQLHGSCTSLSCITSFSSCACFNLHH